MAELRAAWREAIDADAVADALAKETENCADAEAAPALEAEVTRGLHSGRIACGFGTGDGPGTRLLRDGDGADKLEGDLEVLLCDFDS